MENWTGAISAFETNRHVVSYYAYDPTHRAISLSLLQSGAEWGSKFWLDPVSLAKNYGFPSNELNKLAQLVEKHKPKLQQVWNRFHG